MRFFITALACLLSVSVFGQIPFPSGSKILCLGDSRVEGSETYDSYRYELWKDLIDCSWDFDFVGAEIDPILYPSYQNNTFDCGIFVMVSAEIIAEYQAFFDDNQQLDL